MKRYRILLIPFGTSPAEERAFSCSDEGELLAHCHMLLADARSAEAWDGDRLVCRLTWPSTGRA